MLVNLIDVSICAWHGGSETLQGTLLVLVEFAIEIIHSYFPYVGFASVEKTAMEHPLILRMLHVFVEVRMRPSAYFTEAVIGSWRTYFKMAKG